MELLHQQVVTNNDVINIDIYQDIIAFLKRLVEKPIKLTVIGNISLRDIKKLLVQLRTTKHIIDEHAKYNWKVRSEWDLQTLTQIKILLLVMGTIHKRKGYIYINKTGETFLSQCTPLQQYEQIVLTFGINVTGRIFPTQARLAHPLFLKFCKISMVIFGNFFCKKILRGLITRRFANRPATIFILTNI